MFCRILPMTHRYSVTNETGENVDASIYIRKKENCEELILIFNNIESKNILIINRSLKSIGLSEGGKKEFIRINSVPFLIQISKKANNYMVINNLINIDLIKKSEFHNTKIVFDTFWEYKKVGKKIVINTK